MTQPLGNPLRNLFERYPAACLGTAALVILTFGFWWAGTLSPDELPTYATSRREVIGMALMLIALPAYFMATSILIRRYSLDLIESLRSEVGDPAYVDDARESIRGALKKAWIPGVVLGLAMGSFNTSIPEALTATAAPTIHRSITLGQLLLWVTIGVFFAERLNAARTFRRLGGRVEIDLFTLDRLQPLARSGLADVMIIAHRDRIQDLRTWLLSANMLSRFFLYLIIPPLAWVGAAIVERFVDQMLNP